MPKKQMFRIITENQSNFVEKIIFWWFQCHEYTMNRNGKSELVYGLGEIQLLTPSSGFLRRPQNFKQSPT